MRVVAAMSGGVDSAVAAARAVEAGHDVTGIHLALSRNPASYRSGARGCCTIEDANDARRAADVIGIPFYVWDLSERFHEDVVEDFMDEYAAGRTPNPCLRCNEKIKFAAVLDRALGARLRRGRDRPLRAAARPATTGWSRCTGRSTTARTSPTCSACSTSSSCAHSLFPLGDTDQAGRARGGRATRAAGRRQARQPRHLLRRRRRQRRLARREARRPRPQPRRRHRRLRLRRGARPARRAPTASPSASARGSGSGGPAPDGKPRFVLDIEPVSGTVTVGSARASSPSTGSPAAGPAGAAPSRPGSTARRDGAAARPRRRAPRRRGRRRRPGRDRAARPGVRHRARARRPSSTTAPASSGRPRSSRPAGSRRRADDPRHRRRLPSRVTTRRAYAEAVRVVLGELRRRPACRTSPSCPAAASRARP